MRIQVNGEARECATDVSLQELLAQLYVPGDRVAIELNQKVVRRAEWTKVKLREDDSVEIVHFVGGGGVADLTSGGNTRTRELSRFALARNWDRVQKTA